MRTVKTFDLFQKLSYDVNQLTITGGLISIISVALMIFLLIMETISFLTPVTTKNSVIIQDSSSSPVHLLIDIIISAPCAIVSIAQADMIGNHITNVEKDIEKTPLNKRGVLIKNYNPYPPSQIDRLSHSLSEEEKCHVKGKLSLNKVPGDFRISFHEHREIYEQFKGDNSTRKKRQFFNMRVEHSLISLQFVDEKQNKKIISKYGLNEYTEGFIKKNVNTRIDLSKKNNYDYYLKIIPYLFIDEAEGEEINAYQYSLSSLAKDNTESEEMPIITFNYNFSPITMKIVKIKKSVPRFLTHICAIIGGVFVFFSVLNSIINTCNERKIN